MHRCFSPFLTVAMISLLATGCGSDDPAAIVTPPTANAGLPQDGAPGEEVFLDGSASVGDGLRYVWSQASGTPVTLSDSSAVVTTFIAPDEFGVLSFELEVIDERNASDVDMTLVSVIAAGNNRPSAEAGADQRVGVGVTVGLFGSGTDPDDDPLTFSWRQYAGEPADIALSPSSSVARPTFTAPSAPTTLSFELTVDDGNGGTAMDSTNVVVEASPTPGLPTLWVFNSSPFQSNQNISGWTLPALPLPDNEVEPQRRIEGTATMLQLGATDIDVDANGAVLASISPFSEAARITSYLPLAGIPNIAPDRVVQGPSTLLENPMVLALDRPGDVLYVVDEDGVLIFNDVSTGAFDGDVAPSRTILLLSSRYDAVAADLGPGGRLYIADRNVNSGSVWVYDSAATDDGLTAPTRVISGSSTVGITDVFVDDGDRMYVCVLDERRIHVWDDASNVAPDQGPDRTIRPNFGNTRPGALTVNLTNAGYVVDPLSNVLLKFENIHVAEGGVNNDGSLRANALRSPQSIVIGK